MFRFIVAQYLLKRAVCTERCVASIATARNNPRTARSRREYAQLRCTGVALLSVAAIASWASGAFAETPYWQHTVEPFDVAGLMAQPADLSLTKTVNTPTPVIGAQVIFRVTLTNAGPSPVQQVVVRDRLPGGYTYVSHQVARGTYTPSNGQWSGFGIAAGGSATLTLVATVQPSGNRMNVAEVVYSTATDPDSTPANHNPMEDDYARATTTPRPNIVVIMLDDLDARSLDDLLNAGFMPNLKTHVVERGIQFSEAYVSNPLCCPSRATFLTGKYPHNTGIVSNLLMYPEHRIEPAVGLFDDSVTIATRLRALGYTTAHIGKYLNGYGSDPALATLSPAFDPHYVPPGWSHWSGLVDPFTYCVYDYVLNDDGVLSAYSRPAGETEDSATYQTHVLADRAESFVLAHRDDAAPFYLQVMPLAPHAEECEDAYGGPEPDQDTFESRIRPAPEDASAPVPAFVPGSSYDEDVADKPSWLSGTPPLTATDRMNIAEQYRQRLRAVLAVDRMIGRIATALGPKINETLLIFTSDNGWLYGDHRSAGKIYPYRESASVPLYFALPGSSAPATRGNLVLNNDLAPTILDLAAPGYSDPQFDGRSLAPILVEAAPPGWQDRSQFLIEYGRAIAHPSQDGHPTYSALRSTGMLYVESYGGMYFSVAPPALIGLERYDLLTDPSEMNSLLHHPEHSRDAVLGSWLDLLSACVGQECALYENAQAGP